MRTFKYERECTKCGGGDKYAVVEYIRANSKYGRVHEEYLERTCRKCGYTWEESPLDFEKDNDS